MKSQLEYYVDDVVDTDVALNLFNEGKNRMATAVKAILPDLTTVPGAGDKFVFDDRFHIIPVYYAAAMVKANDSSLTEKDSFMGQFENSVKDFVQNYVPPVIYQDSETTQQFKVTDPAGQSNFIVTKDTFNMYGNVFVYVDGAGVDFGKYGNTVTLSTPAPMGAVVSIQWDPDQFGQVAPWLKGW